MRRIHVIVMNTDLLISTPGLGDRMSNGLALQQIEVQSRREYENFPRVAAANCGG